MGFAQWIDWWKEREDYEKWRNHGRRVRRENCNHYDADEDNRDIEDDDDKMNNIEYQDYCDECGVSEDSEEPMMNYIYPLEFDHYDDEKILQVVERTACTVMENTETGEWFLTLCGGGMDLSQDIALAYHIMDKWLPLELLQRVCKQPGLSISKEDFRTIGAIIVEQAEMEKQRFARLEEEWKEKIGLVEVKA
jgi:hypothetical protein